MKTLTAHDRSELSNLAAEAEKVKVELSTIMPRIAEARGNAIRCQTEDAFRNLELVEKEGAVASRRIHEILQRMTVLMDFSEEELQLLEGSKETGDVPPRYNREQLTADQLPSDGRVDELLERNFDALLSHMPASILEKFRNLDSDAPWIKQTSGLLSIVKGIVVESEYPKIHRFAQSIGVSRALLANDQAYDIFAGSSLIPQIARLAERVGVLSEIPGAMKRLRSLWHGPSTEVDSTVFELLVAAGCAMKGREVAFMERQSGKTADLRCWEPYPLVIECKRKQVLTKYEKDEESVMRNLFMKLEAGARDAGMWGVFTLHLSVESKSAPIDEIVASILRMKLSAGTDKVVTGLWGAATYSELDRVVYLGGHTRMYSPVLLGGVFGWNSDLAEWDGIVCRISNHSDLEVDQVKEPVGLLWVNSCEQAIKKRSWGPMSTLSEAIEQIPLGEFGIPYIAYQEGARCEIADMRTFSFADWLKGFGHSANIRVPMGQVIRWYPRPLGHGAPDFIESSMHFIPDYGDDVLPEMFPSNVIVR